MNLVRGSPIIFRRMFLDGNLCGIVYPKALGVFILASLLLAHLPLSLLPDAYSVICALLKTYQDTVMNTMKYIKATAIDVRITVDKDSV